MWVVFALILGALVFYLLERAAMEMTSLGIICVLLIFFHFFPVVGANGAAPLPPEVRRLVYRQVFPESGAFEDK